MDGCFQQDQVAWTIMLLIEVLMVDVKAFRQSVFKQRVVAELLTHVSHHHSVFVLISVWGTMQSNVTTFGSMCALRLPHPSNLT